MAMTMSAIINVAMKIVMHRWEHAPSQGTSGYFRRSPTPSSTTPSRPTSRSVTRFETFVRREDDRAVHRGSPPRRSGGCGTLRIEERELGQLTDEIKVDEPVAWACARDREGRSRVFGSSEQSENGRSSRSALRSREDPTSEIDEAESHCPYNGHHEKA